MTAPRWHSISGLAKTLGFSRSTVRSWWLRGRFGPLDACIQVAGDVRIPQDGVDLFIAAHKINRTEESSRRERALMAARLAGKGAKTHA